MDKRIKHNLWKHPLYGKWQDMKNRCHNPKYVRYGDWGGRGIIVCDKWRHDFKVFYDYVTKLTHYGKPGRTLDRFPNNDGNYEPGNVRWATKHQQSVNKRKQSNNPLGYIGVYGAGSRYKTNIRVNGKLYYIGYFKEIKNAVKARNAYIIKNGLTEYKIQEIN